MTRFIIFVEFGKQIREALVQHLDTNWGHEVSEFEEFSIHPSLKIPGVFSAFDKAKYVLQSDRPIWRKRGVKRRPNYKLIKGEIRNSSHLEALVKAVDKFVEKNMD